MKKLLEWIGMRKPKDPVYESCEAIETLSMAEAMERGFRLGIAESLGFGDELSNMLAGLKAKEGPTSACWDCGRLVKPEEIYVGKQSGTALCKVCLGIWVAAGRAKQGAEF